MASYMTQPKLNTIDEHETIGKFLRKFPKYKTKHGYKYALKRFFDFLKVNPDEWIKDVRLMDNGTRIKTLDGYEDDITAFWSDLINKDVPPKTLNYVIAVIRVFLCHHRIEIPDVFWKDLRRRGSGNQARTIDEPITREMLQSILTHGDTKSRALFLMLSSSGMRVGEALKLKPSDINFTSTPTKITIRAEITKNKTGRITFISDEATRFLKEWLKERDAYLKTSAARTHIKCYHGLITKSMDDDRVFPFSIDTARNIWNRLIEKAELFEKDERTERITVHIHGLRKFFRTYFSRSESARSRDVVEILMGHRGYLLPEYFKLSPNQLKEEYLVGMKYLLVFERSSKDLEEQVKKEVELRMKVMEQKIYEDLKERLSKEGIIEFDWKEIKKQ